MQVRSPDIETSIQPLQAIERPVDYFQDQGGKDNRMASEQILKYLRLLVALNKSLQ
jgi:hypothetical protein